MILGVADGRPLPAEPVRHPDLSPCRMWRTSSVLLQVLRGDWDYEDAGLLDKTHLRFFTPKSIVASVRHAGLTPVFERWVCSLPHGASKRSLFVRSTCLRRIFWRRKWNWCAVDMRVLRCRRTPGKSHARSIDLILTCTPEIDPPRL